MERGENGIGTEKGKKYRNGYLFVDNLFLSLFFAEESVIVDKIISNKSRDRLDFLQFLYDE